VAASSGVVVCSTAGCSFEFGTYPIGMDPMGQRRPCRLCGGFTRTIQQPLGVDPTAHATLGHDAHPPGSQRRRRRFAWGVTGWDLSRKLGRIARKDSHFDKRSDPR
jgi:hypothetical protein